MIHVQMSLWPGGDKTGARSLGEAEIANVGGTLASGDYAVRLLRAGARRAVWKLGKVVGFPRERLGAWDLLLRALADILNANETGVRRTIAVPADWQKPISEAALEAAEAEGVRDRSEPIADAIRAWLAIEGVERERVARVIASGDVLGNPSESARRAAIELLKAWSGE